MIHFFPKQKDSFLYFIKSILYRLQMWFYWKIFLFEYTRNWLCFLASLWHYNLRL